jgi:hypothetical protein
MPNANVDEEREEIPDWLRELEQAETEAGVEEAAPAPATEEVEAESEAPTSTESSWWLTDDLAEDRTGAGVALQTKPTPTKSSSVAVTIEEPLYCINHPTVETRLRCNRCNAPICPKCAVRTPVGFRCPQCVRGQQAVFYTAAGGDYLIAAVVSLPLAVVAGFIMNYLGWFFAIFLGPLIGGLIAEAVHRATGRRRGRSIKWVVGICIVAGALAAPLFSVLYLYLFVPGAMGYITLAPASLISQLLFRVNIVYVILAVATASARLR